MLWMLAASGALIGVDATGMEPQLRAIRTLAAQRGWTATCQGHAGEEGVIRLKAPPSTDQSQIEAFANDALKVASATYKIDATAASKTCDHEAISDGGSAPQRALAFGPAAKLESLRTVARSCGYERAYVRPRNPTDDKVAFAWILPPPTTHTLDTGDNQPSRYGPRVCFMIMGIRPLGVAMLASAPGDP